MKVDIVHHFKRKQTLLNTPAISKKVMPARDSVGSPNKAKNQLKAADDVAMQVDTLILENIGFGRGHFLCGTSLLRLRSLPHVSL